MQKIDIIQFLPYFPPHKGWLETHAEEWAIWWTKKWYGNVVNVSNDVGHNYDENRDWIEKNGRKIGYTKEGYTTYLVPSFDLIHNFPVPKFWTKEYKEVMKELRTISGEIVLTRTRFFLSSILGGLWAKKHGRKWIHTEHGSDSVVLEKQWKTSLANIYDSLFGRYIFSKAQMITAVSEWSREFVKKRWGYVREIPVIYRGIEVLTGERKAKRDTLIHIGFVGRVVKLKWVDILIAAIKTLLKTSDNIELSIVWDGDQKEPLEKEVKKSWLEGKIQFLWEKSREWIAKEYLPTIDILVNPSFQEWLPTTVLEWLSAWCIVVATDVGGTREISDKDDLILVEKGNIASLEWGLRKAIGWPQNSYLSKNSGELDKFVWSKNIESYYQLFHTFLYGK